MTQNVSRKHLKSAEEKMSWQSKADHGSSSGVAMAATHSTAQKSQSPLVTNNPYPRKIKTYVRKYD